MLDRQKIADLARQLQDIMDEIDENASETDEFWNKTYWTLKEIKNDMEKEL